MGLYNIKDVIDGFKAGNLENVIDKYDQNDLAFILKELKGYLAKHDNPDELKELLDILQTKIDSYN